MIYKTDLRRMATLSPVVTLSMRGLLNGFITRLKVDVFKQFKHLHYIQNINIHA